MKVSNFKISKLVHYVENNMVKEGVEKHLQFFDNKLEKTKTNNDISIIDEDLTNKDMRVTMTFNKFFEKL